MRGILFVRKYPSCLAPGRVEGLRRSFNSVFGNGQRQTINGHEVTFLFSGYGDHTKEISESVIDDINSGAISDVVDFGAGGALNPALKVGDLVLSTGDVSKYLRPCMVRRQGVEPIVRKIAADEGRGFYTGKILTSHKIIARREERLAYWQEYETQVVQMEHLWLVNQLRRATWPEAFRALHFTHVEVVADEVPRLGASRVEGFRNFLRAMDICVFRNDKHLGRLKAKFLTAFTLGQV